MLEQQMSNAAEELALKLFGAGGDLLSSASKGMLISIDLLTQSLSKEEIDDKRFITVDDIDLKDYEKELKKLGVNYDVASIPDDDKTNVMFSSADIDKVQKAINTVIISRSLVNEMTVSDFLETHTLDTITKISGLDAVELELFREEANVGLLRYAVFYDSHEREYGLICPKDQENLLNENIESVFNQLEGINGDGIRGQIEYRLAGRNAINIELEKANTEFIVCDAEKPKTYIHVNENDFQYYKNTKQVHSYVNPDTAAFNSEVSHAVDRIRNPLIMSLDEYNDEKVRLGLVSQHLQIHPKTKAILGSDGLDLNIVNESLINKQKQLTIINLTNPMRDENHVGIRHLDDVKTLQEAFDVDLEDGEIDAWGDHPEELYLEAIESNQITVYSSKDIVAGDFVSVSFTEALQYAGGDPDRVNQKVVSISDVAWIYSNEGQYAPISEYDQILDNNKPDIQKAMNKLKREDIALSKKTASNLTHEINKASVKKNGLSKETSVKNKDLEL